MRLQRRLQLPLASRFAEVAVRETTVTKSTKTVIETRKVASSGGSGDFRMLEECLMFVHGQLVRDRRDEFGSVVDVPPPPPVVNASSAPAPYASPRFIFYHRSFEIHTRFREVLMRNLAKTPNPAHPIDHFIM